MFLSHQQYKESTKEKLEKLKSIKSRGTCLEIRAQIEKSLTNNLYDTTVEFLMDADPSLCNELKMYKNICSILADLYAKFNEVQKRLQVQGMTVIQAQTILMGFQVKIRLFKSSLARKDFKYFFKPKVI